MKVLFIFLRVIAIFLISVMLIVGLSMCGFPRIAALLGVIVFIVLLFYNHSFRNDSKTVRRSYWWKIILALLFGALVLPTFLIAFKVPEMPPYEVDGLQMEILPLSKGEKMSVVSFISEDTAGKQTILFINGGPGGPLVKETLNFLKEISKRGYDVYSFDHYSSGRSQWEDPDPSLLTIDDEIRRLNEIVDYISKGQKIHLIGHSYAGVLIGRFLSKYPGKVSTATCLDTSPLFDLSNRGNTRQQLILNLDLAKQYNAASNSDSNEVLQDETEMILESTRDLPYYHKLRLALVLLWEKEHKPVLGTIQESSYVFGRILSPSKPFLGLSTIAQRINEDIEKSPDYYQTLMKKVTPPILVVHPEDGVVPWEIHKDYESFFDKVFFLPWPGATHSVWDTRGNELVANIDDFIRTDSIKNNYDGMADPFEK